MYDVEKVRALNDAARTTLTVCRVMFTQGVTALECTDEVLAAVTGYTAFDNDRDPHGKHFIGRTSHEGAVQHEAADDGPDTSAELVCAGLAQDCRKHGGRRYKHSDVEDVRRKP